MKRRKGQKIWPLKAFGRTRRGERKTAEQSFDEYLRKAGGIPGAGAGSDRAVYDAASWARFNLPDLSENSFTRAIQTCQPDFDERWITQKWKSANR